MAEVNRHQRVLGSVVGSAVGDALGAPFEFGPPGAFSARFPSALVAPETDMCGGGSCGWRPGACSDDTQMALLVAASLLGCGGVDETDLFVASPRGQRSTRPTSASGPAVLTSPLGWCEAARRHFKAGGPAAGNGSLMRTTPAAVFFARVGEGHLRRGPAHQRAHSR